MNTKWRVLSGSIAVCALAIATIGMANGFSHKAHASTIPIAANALQSGYGIGFKPASSGVTSQKIDESQAMSAIGKMMGHTPSDATFGYLTLNQYSNVRIPPTDSAGKSNHGIVTQYPVWLVRIEGLHLLPSAPALPPSASAKARQELSQKMQSEAQNAEYGFVDANNGQILFVVTLNQST